MGARYTVDGGPALEARVAEDLARVRERILASAAAPDVLALLLGGGYGRGEGAVTLRAGREAPYNDYDCFVVARPSGRRRLARLRADLAAASVELSAQLGLEVDFGVPLASAALPRLPYTLMMMELREGHRVLHGRADVLAALPAWDPTSPPLEEGARLMLNRGAGLLLARARLDAAGAAATAEDSDFALRNAWKAVMAQGDVVLMAGRRYATSYVARAAAAATLDGAGLPRAEELRSDYARALRFKLRPEDAVPGDDLPAFVRATAARHGELFLWLERRRLGRPGLDAAGYAALPRRLAPGSPAEVLLNLARSVRAFGPRALLRPVRSLLHPRDLLLGQLPALLAGELAPGREAAFLAAWRVVN